MIILYRKLSIDGKPDPCVQDPGNWVNMGFVSLRKNYIGSTLGQGLAWNQDAGLSLKHRRTTLGRYNERLSASGKRCLAIWFLYNLCFALGAIEQRGFLSVPDLLWHPFIMVISEDLWHSHLLPNVWLPVFTTWVCRGWDSNFLVDSPFPLSFCFGRCWTYILWTRTAWEVEGVNWIKFLTWFLRFLFFSISVLLIYELHPYQF